MKQLDFLRKIKSVTFCTVENGCPKARIIDVMFIEDNKIYFTTARGKSFYRQLMNNPNVAVVGMDQNYKTIRVHGKAQKVNHHIIDKIFELNPMMNDIYAGEKRDILEPFCIYEGSGEIFNLGEIPLHRERFSFGGKDVFTPGYKITDKCISCGICKEVCPENCISNDPAFSIDGSGCLECGRCFEHCPVDAIEKPEF
jgi:uncharacterized pyridoxamine 5'-phosphate oxidase family protein/NAD-dependent dihydropyrimidine dehydrogenase PreA subunit